MDTNEAHSTTRAGDAIGAVTTDAVTTGTAGAAAGGSNASTGTPAAASTVPAIDDSARAAGDSFARLAAINAHLRSPDGCPWDREQTPESLREHLVEETYECVDAIDSGDAIHVREELGDVMLLVGMIARIYEEHGSFSVHEVVDELNAKLIRRHPHVFGDSVADSPDTVIAQWNDIKTRIEGKPDKSRSLDAVPRSLHPLDRAYKLQRAAAKLGFDWPTLSGVRAKIVEELEETVDAAGGAGALNRSKDALKRQNNDTSSEGIEEEVGDLLFSCVNLARYLGVNPAVALNAANQKFVGRFAVVEERMAEAGTPMRPENLDAMDAFWNGAK